MIIHVHQWIFLGELAIAITEVQIRSGDASFRRLEYCSDCGSIRAKFNHGWAYLFSDTSREHLKKFDIEEDLVVNKPPKHLIWNSPGEKRLGKSLKDLKQQPNIAISDMMMNLFKNKKNK
jgi:hypothetical protein